MTRPASSNTELSLSSQKRTVFTFNVLSVPMLNRELGDRLSSLHACLLRGLCNAVIQSPTYKPNDSLKTLC